MGTGMAIFLIILFVLCVILLLPLRVKAHFGDGKWGVAVYYLCFRLWHKESQPKAPPETPPQPDAAEQEAESAEETPSVTEAAPESEPQEEPQPENAPPEEPPAPEADSPQDEPPADSPEPAESTETEDADAADTSEEPADEDGTESENTPPDTEEPDGDKPEKPKKGIKGYIARLKPHSLSDALKLLKDGFAAVGPAVRFLLRHFHFRHLKLYLAVGTDDPANTAELYGKICAAAFPLFAQLQCLFDIETDEFRILSDFFDESITFRISAELRVSPAALILTVLILGIKFLWRTWRRFKREDKEQAQYEKESQPLSEAA